MPVGVILLFVCFLGFTSSLFAGSAAGLYEAGKSEVVIYVQASTQADKDKVSEASSPTTIQQKKFELSLGAGVLHGPEYEGHVQ